MKWALLGVASLALGALAQWIHVPAAWLIAPMIVAIVAAVGGINVRLPHWSLTIPQGIISVTIAQVFTLPVVGEVVHQWVPILIVVVATVVAAGTAGWLLAHHSPISAPTAAWGSSPGAAVTMIAMSSEFGADARIVAFMQYLRVTLVVLTASLVSHLVLAHGVATVQASSAPGTRAFEAVPFLLTLGFAIAAAFAGRYSFIPGGQFMVPLIGGAALHVMGRLPIDVTWWMLDAAYITVGWTIGLQYTRALLIYIRGVLPTLLLSTLVLLGMCALSGVLLVVLLHVDPLTAYLATTPGGLDSVSIIALGSGSNVALVLAIQMLRVFAVIASGPPLAKFIGKYA
jgi:membrane AbrB-like protein